MKKHTLKAFTTSFCFSLFTISLIGSFLSHPKRNTSSIEVIPSNNIVLFLKETNKQAKHSPIAQIKKISLNSIKPIQVKKSAAKNIPLEYNIAKQESNLHPKKIIAQLIENSFIEEIPITYEKKTIQKEKIIEDYASFIKKPAKVTIASLEDKKVLYSQAKELATKNITTTEEVLEENKMPLIKDKNLIFGKHAKFSSAENSNNMVAQNSEAQFTQTSTEDSNEAKEDTDTPIEDIPWIEMKDTQATPPTKQDAWSIANGTKHSKNRLMRPSETEEKKTASKNILIPIPEELSKEDISLPKINTPKESVLEETDEDEDEEILPITNDVKTKKTSKILKGLEDLFSKKPPSNTTKEENAEEVETVINKKANNDYKESAANKDNKKEILPSEIRLSFAPNRVGISGQTLKWLTAFAQKAKEEKGILEIRLDGSSSVETQQKRLALISNIFASKGINKKQIRTIFTNREPNSFIIKIASDTDKSTNIENYYKYYQQ